MTSKSDRKLPRVERNCRESERNCRKSERNCRENVEETTEKIFLAREKERDFELERESNSREKATEYLYRLGFAAPLWEGNYEDLII